MPIVNTPRKGMRYNVFGGGSAGRCTLRATSLGKRPISDIFAADICLPTDIDGYDCTASQCPCDSDYLTTRKAEEMILLNLKMIPPLIRTIISRLLLGVLTLAAVSVIIFSTVSMLPGNFATAVLGQSATPETVAAFKSRLGLDQPVATRYFKWVGGILHGDLGESLSSSPGAPRFVADIISSRLRNTFLLASVTALIAVPLSIVLGVLCALYRGTAFDRVVNGISLTTISIPEFLIAYILLIFVAVRLRWLPTLSNVKDGMDVADWVWRMTLPVLVLTIGIIAHMMRMTRSAIIGVLSSPYIHMAKCKGASPARVILRHALPNAWAPIANVVAVNLAYLVVGVVVVETVFVYPGIGQTMVDAVRTRDLPLVQACALIFASAYILLNLVADIIAISTNPKLLHPR